MTCIIETGVVVSSTSTAIPAFEVGDWPFGLEIIIDHRGTCVAKDGNGGKGGSGGSWLANGGAAHRMDFRAGQRSAPARP